MSNIQEIADVEGVDMLFIGPMDLSTNVGCFGNFLQEQQSREGKEWRGSIEEISHRLKNSYQYPKDKGPNSNPIPRGEAPRDWIGIYLCPRDIGKDFSFHHNC